MSIRVISDLNMLAFLVTAIADLMNNEQLERGSKISVSLMRIWGESVNCIFLMRRSVYYIFDTVTF